MIRACGCIISLPFIVLMLARCGEPTIPETPASLLFVTVDTLRPDALHCYGDERRISPVIDGLASRGVLYENAYCQVPITRASHASMFTGLQPPQHGVRANDDYRLAESARTLAELLKLCFKECVSSP